MSSMYPDLNEDSQKSSNLATQDHLPQSKYQSTATTQQQEEQKKKKKKDAKKGEEKCCIIGAKLWISIVGIISALLGLFIVCISLYAKFGYTDYASLSAALPAGGIWMLFGFGLVLMCFSVILIISACFYHNGCFKVILIVFSIILAILLILEIVSASIMMWGLGIIALPENKIDNAAANQLLKARNATSYKTWHECCVENVPPYDSQNVTTIDSACLWPNKAVAVQQECGDENVLVCVCKSSTKYAAYFGLFLQSRLMWVGIVTIILALLLLGGLVATCVLICAKKKKNDGMYHAK